MSTYIISQMLAVVKCLSACDQQIDDTSFLVHAFEQSSLVESAKHWKCVVARDKCHIEDRGRTNKTRLFSCNIKSDITLRILVRVRGMYERDVPWQLS